MSTAEKVHQLPLTPRELAQQFLQEAVDSGDLEWEPKFAKAVNKPNALR